MKTDLNEEAYFKFHAYSICSKFLIIMIFNIIITFVTIIIVSTIIIILCRLYDRQTKGHVGCVCVCVCGGGCNLMYTFSSISVE